MIKSCYIHIPFCDSICSYCDFCKMFYDEKYVDNYLDALDKEINERYKGEVLDTVYIGGGTPSILNLKQLRRLFEVLNKLNKSDDVEYTIECNFSSITKEKLKLFKENNINRLSLGLESINKNNLKLLERDIDSIDVVRKIQLMRNIGFNNINVDLIYALPNETLEILENDIDFVISLDVEHVSTYSLIIEQNTKLGINKIENISDELDYSMYCLINDKLKNNNYNHYEISNFSKEGFESKHNKCYWFNNNYYGFGLGASSYIDNKRITNTRAISKYFKGSYTYETDNLTKDDIIEYEIMLGLRMLSGIKLKLFFDKYGINLSELYEYNSLITSGFLKLQNDHLFIPEDKIYVSNEIIVKLLQNKK